MTPQAKAELEMFFRMTVAEGVAFLQWMESTERALRTMQGCSGSITSEDWRAQSGIGKESETPPIPGL